MFGAKRVDKAVYNRQGLAKVEHKPPMWKDLTELFDSTAFGLNDPEKLQNFLKNFPIVTQTIPSGRQPAQSLTMRF